MIKKIVYINANDDVLGYIIKIFGFTVFKFTYETV